MLFQLGRHGSFKISIGLKDCNIEALDLCQGTTYQQTASVSNMIKTLGWESLEDRRKKLRVQMLYKIINNIVILPSTPLSRMESSCYDLRDFNNQRINPLFSRTDTYKYSFYPQAIKLWNNLPCKLLILPHL